MTDNTAAVLPPGSVVGIMGGGQLGRMIAVAAARLGYRCTVFCGSEDDPAAQVCDTVIAAPYDDPAALKRFAEHVDVVTFEFENLPRDAAEWLSEHTLVRPNVRSLEIAQNRVREKSFLNHMGVETAPWIEIDDTPALDRAWQEMGAPAVFKTAQFGYDGKGQAMIRSHSQLNEAWESVGKVQSIVEGFVDFSCEVSVIVARAPDGTVKCFDVVENQHANHILDVTIAPARIAPETAQAAQNIAISIAKALDLIGLLAVEMFVTKTDGVIVNEIAPRPHNSGHWSIDACVTDQFEQMVRAVCGLPLGDPSRHSNALMRNLIGDQASRWPDILREPEANLHLYGKSEARPGRKMGHVTRLYPLAEKWAADGVETAMKAFT
jgi:5-(carboxyamino)imidazole ribonucleotide synthase